MASSTSTAVIAAGAAVTLQFFRISIDLIGSASVRQAASELAEADKKHHHSTTTAAFFQKKPNHYGSVPTSDDVEEQNANGQQQQVPWTPFQTKLPKISLGVHAVLALFLIILSVLRRDNDVLSRPLLDVTALALVFGSLLCWRDMTRSRFGSIQRFFYVLVGVLLWAAYFVPVVVGRDSATHVDWIVLVLMTCYAGMVMLESRVIPTPVATITGGKKPVLSRQAILVLLKPYFWPDATDCSAARNRIRAIFTWVCVILSKVCNLVSPILLGWASTALTRQDYATCIKYSILYAIVGLFGSTFKEGQSLVYLKVAQAAFVQLSEVAFHHLHSLSLDWHLRKKLGETIRSMDRGIAACDTLMKYLFLWLVPALAECIVVCIIFATYFHYLPMAICVFYFVFIYMVWTIWVTLWRKKFRKAVVESDNEWHDLCTDSLINFETVKYFTAETYEMKRFGDAVKKYQSGSVDVAASLSFLNITQKVLLQTCLAVSLSMAVLGIRERMACCVENGCESGNSQCCSDMDDCSGMQVGDFIAVLTYVLGLFAPLNFLGSVYNAIVMAVIDLTNLSELLAESPDVVDAPDAVPLPTRNETDPSIAIEFDNVVFHYPTQPKSSGLKGLSFKMKRGTTTAIIGSTGAGKTTISRLLFRFYDVMGGAVKVNGVDVRTVTQKSLRGAIGVVPQSASMFNDTLRANILYGRRGASQKELDRAAEDAQLTSFIDTLDDGWDTMVGDRGLKLSGGEKQRTAIARCLLKDPPFVVLDEATSALDTITENSVQEALDSLGTERTVLVIAHRLGTIRNADNIIVLRDGLVAEEGTHDELMKRNGLYAEMWNMQLKSTRDERSPL